MNDEAVGSTVLPVELIVRASCGAVRPEYLG
jgi:hypothetical protein